MNNFGSPFTIGDPSSFMQGGMDRDDAPPAPIRAMIQNAMQRRLMDMMQSMAPFNAGNMAGGHPQMPSQNMWTQMSGTPMPPWK